MDIVRPEAVAGTLYAQQPASLASEVDALLDAAPLPRSIAEVVALIVPHAGYSSSGPIAASAYAAIRALAPRIRRVALFGPSHFSPVEGIALPDGTAFHTPLGKVPLDVDAMRRLLALPQVVISGDAHARDHAIEVQLPFLQRLLPGGFLLVPFAVGAAAPGEVAAIIDALADDETLVLVSSNLSRDLAYTDAQTADRATAEHILRCEPVSRQAACGAAPLNGLLEWAGQLRLRPELLDLGSSGDAGGGHGSVVGYGAFAFTRAVH